MVLLSISWRQFQNIRCADWKIFSISILFLAFVVLMPSARLGHNTSSILTRSHELK